MKVFLTGATGFIGSNLAPKLINQNHEVYALVRYVSNRTPNLPKEVKVLTGNMTDYQILKGYIKQIKPDAVVHLAAQSAVRESFRHPQEFMETNLMGTINLAQANLDNPNLEKFIFAGTSEEYGNQDEFPIKETAELRPNQPYAISKVASDMYLQYLAEAYEFPTCILRPFNTYGRVENFNFVTERIIHQMLTGDKVSLGNEDPVRDLMYIDDHVDGYLKALKAKVFPRAVNICTGVGVTIEELYYLLVRLTDFTGEVVWNKSLRRPTEIWKLGGDNSLAKETIGWVPKFSLETGLAHTIGKIRNKLGLSGFHDVEEFYKD